MGHMNGARPHRKHIFRDLLHILASRFKDFGIQAFVQTKLVEQSAAQHGDLITLISTFSTTVHAARRVRVRLVYPSSEQDRAHRPK
jgi:hypothetical protein